MLSGVEILPSKDLQVTQKLFSRCSVLREVKAVFAGLAPQDNLF